MDYEEVEPEDPEFDDVEDVLVKVKVTDTGIGIREEDMDKLFMNFARLDEKKNRIMLGLRLLKGIDLNAWFLKYNENLEENESIKKLIKDKLLVVKDNHLCVNPKKLYIMNEILLKII